MASLPQGWKQKQGSSFIYEANIKPISLSTGTVYIAAETDKTNGNYSVSSTSGTNFGGGKNALYSVTSSGTRTVQNQSLYGSLQGLGEIEKIDASVKSSSFKINQSFGTDAEKQTVANSVLYKSQANAAPSNGFPTPQTPQQGGYQSIEGLSISINQPTPAAALPSNRLTYPLKMRPDQDRIKFTAFAYQASGDLNTGTIQQRNRKTTENKTPLGSVFLPVQASITDANSVDWQGAGLNFFEKSLANLSGKVMRAETYEKLEQSLGNAATAYSEAIKKYGNEARIYLAQEAVGIQNLLGRFGSVLNPNLELLFSGPQLRPFEFRFQMMARDPDEARVIKQIINFFKKNMAVKKTDDGIFLKAPNTFFIEYQKGGFKHKSINQIKECALTNCSIDYTPLGTYMTFDDEEATMVSYAMTLSFQELEPIYADDYNDNHPIGY